MEAMRTEVTRARRAAKETARRLREEGHGFDRADLWGDGASRGADGREEQTVKIPKWKEFHEQILEDEGFKAEVKANQKGVLASGPSTFAESGGTKLTGKDSMASVGSAASLAAADDHFDDARITAEAQAQIDEWRKIFEECDIDDSGYLDNDELVEVVRRWYGTDLVPGDTELMAEIQMEVLHPLKGAAPSAVISCTCCLLCPGLE